MNIGDLYDLYRCPKCKRARDIESVAKMVFAECKICDTKTLIEDQWNVEPRDDQYTANSK